MNLSQVHECKLMENSLTRGLCNLGFWCVFTPCPPDVTWLLLYLCTAGAL